MARQPITDRRLRTIGYEVSCREGAAGFGGRTTDDSANLANLLLESGVKRVGGNLPVWVSVPESYFLQGTPVPVSPEGLVIEIREDTEPTERTLKRLRGLVSEGYRLALKVFVVRPELEPFLELVRYVKIDIRGRAAADLAGQIDCFRRHQLSPVAEQVETMEDFDLCLKAGFDWFQGYCMLRPELADGNVSASSRLAVLRSLSEIYARDTDLRRIESLVSLDTALSHRLLRFLNSSLCGPTCESESMQGAFAMLGLPRVRNLLSLSVVGGLSDKPSEVFTTALIRARTLELLTRRTANLNSDSAFAVGLLSVLDAWFDSPMNSVLATLPLSDELRQALVWRRGEYGRLLRGLEAHEQGNLRRVLEAKLDPMVLVRFWLVGIDWAAAVRQALNDPAIASRTSGLRHPPSAYGKASLRTGV